MSQPISRFPVPAIDALPADLRDRALQVQEKTGFVPNVFLALAHRPEEMRAFLAYHDALLLKEGGSLTKGEREMIIVATSGANGCLYCVVAHGATPAGVREETVDRRPSGRELPQGRLRRPARARLW